MRLPALGAAGGDDGLVGVGEGAAQGVVGLLVGGQALLHGFGDDVHRHAAGLLAVFLPAHAVGDHEELVVHVGEEAVFVVGALPLRRA